jgi:hypothetical protein
MQSAARRNQLTSAQTFTGGSILPRIAEVKRQLAARRLRENTLNPVILSEAKNLGSCNLNELCRSFVTCGCQCSG